MTRIYRALSVLLLALCLSAVAQTQQAPLTSTLSDLTCAKLEAYYIPPTPGNGTPSGAGLNSPDIIKQNNAIALQRYAVDQPNASALARYDFACKTWAQAKTSTLPTAPAYLVFDANAFDQWWAQLEANTGADAPPLFFIKPASLPPPPVILDPTVPPPPPALDGPIGAAVPGNPGVFNPSASDNFPDGYIYAGLTGVYQKHVYSNPFTAGQSRVIWVKLA